MNKWTAWHDSLPEHQKNWLKNAPIWRDIDLAKFCAISFVVGIAIGAILTWH